MTHDIVIRDATIITSKEAYQANIAVDDGRISAIGVSNWTGDRVIDANGKYVFPGFMDVHTHIRDPGYTHKEDYETASRAAVAGGWTFLSGQPNVKPVPNTVENYMLQVREGEKKSLVDFNPVGSPLLYEENQPEKIAQLGCAFFKIFQKVASYPYDTQAGTINTAHIYKAFQAIARTGRFCSVHPFNNDIFQEVHHDLRKKGPLRYGVEYFSHLYSSEEVVSAAYMLYFFAQKAGLNWYALHVNHPDYIDLVRLAKAQKKIRVISSAEVDGDLFPVTTERPEGDQTRPEYDPERARSLWSAIEDGTIDMIGTDHAPHLPSEMLREDPTESSIGVPVLEWFLPMALYNVSAGIISLTKLIGAITENYARIFQMYPRKGSIQVGSDADLVVVDPQPEYKIKSDVIFTKCGWCPYEGANAKGKILYTLVRGQIMFENGDIAGKSGHGRFIKYGTGSEKSIAS